MHVKVFLTWQSMQLACAHLSNFVKSERNWRPDYTVDLIVALSRGGLTPAVCISHLLTPVFPNLKVYCLGVSSYVEETKGAVEIYQHIDPAAVRGKSVLLIDDLVDRGDSLRDAKDYLLKIGATEVTTAVLYEKQCTTFIPDFKALTAKKESWIVFPWELKEVCATPSID